MAEIAVNGSSVAANAAAALGRDLRALRKSRKLTLAKLAEVTGRSVGHLSQVERGMAEISLTDLRTIADFLRLPVSWFFAHEDVPAHERGVIVRAGSRRRIGTAEDGLIEELLSPDLGGAFEVVRSVFEPGARSANEHSRPTEESVYLVSGTLEVWISGKYLKVQAGDSFRFASEPFRWRNRGPGRTEAIWVIAPPVY
jgi:transcriptional regulator with XRE-family HTH domain